MAFSLEKIVVKLWWQEQGSNESHEGSSIESAR